MVKSELAGYVLSNPGTPQKSIDIGVEGLDSRKGDGRNGIIIH